MKKTALLIGVAILLAVCVPVFAQEFPDVPADHWAYAAVEELAEAGIVIGYPDGTFGGKRAMTRYEFAEALARALPYIVERVRTQAGAPVPAPTPAPTPAQAPAEITKEQFDALQRLVNGFAEELAALGVDVEAIRRDLAALDARLTAVEKELERVRFFGELNIIARGDVGFGDIHDRDGRRIGDLGPNNSNLLSNTAVFTDLQFGVRAKAGDATVNALLAAGNYLRWALSPLWDIDGTVDDVTLWNAYISAPIRLWGFGDAQVTAGRFPFQLTPFTLRFIDPDSYGYVTKLDSGDFVLDGGKVTFDVGTVGLTAFAAKSVDMFSDNGAIITELTTPIVSTVDSYEWIESIGGARATIGLPWEGNLGVHYVQMGYWDSLRSDLWGADFNLKIGTVGLKGEYNQSSANDSFEAYYMYDFDDFNTAWNAMLDWQSGQFMLGAGYYAVELDYLAPGYWSRLGRAVNLRNVKGPMAKARINLTNNIALVAEGQWLSPNDDGLPVVGREALEPADAEIFVSPTGEGNFDDITYYRAGLTYGLSTSNNVDLGWEQVNWNPVVGDATRETYVSIGFTSALGPNSSLRLLYQIVDYNQGSLFPFDDQFDSAHGGVATAQFQLKY